LRREAKTTINELPDMPAPKAPRPTPRASQAAGGPAPVLLVIAGPAGSGKSTLCDRLVAEVPEFQRVVTTTTRAPRAGEVHGLHYHFFSPAEFERRVGEGHFLEWAWVHGERRYGTLKSSVREPLAQGQNLVMSIDVQGVESLRRLARADGLLRQAMTTVFIVVDRKRLIDRMEGRAKDDAAEITRRMMTADAELREAPKFDFIIESRTRDQDFAALLKIVAQARKRAAQS
jgi:guanylate kinase